MELRTAACKECDRPIVWTSNTATGRRMPIDPDPSPVGNIILTAGNSGPRSTVLSRDEAVRRQAERSPRLYLSHFVTCPGAAARRGTGRA